jgi:nicotinamidase-related amidase
MQEQREALSSVVDPRHSALLVVDVQRWFTRERPEPMFPPVEDALRRLRRFIDAARAAGVLVIRIQNVIPDELYSEVWRRQFPGTWGSSSPLATDACVSSTSRDAFQREFHVVTLSDCTAKVTQARHESGLATLAANFGLVR